MVRFQFAKVGEPARLFRLLFQTCMELPAMTAISGSAAAVTGAASGIGRALALELAARGCDLALADRDEAGLQQVAAEIGKIPAGARSARIASMSASPADPGFRAGRDRRPSRRSTSSSTMPASRCSAQFNEVDQAQMEWLININFWGVVHGTRAFLPHLSQTARGAYRQPLLDLRHHRPARPDRLLRGEIRGARLFRKPAA